VLNHSTMATHSQFKSSLRSPKIF